MKVTELFAGATDLALPQRRDGVGDGGALGAEGTTHVMVGRDAAHTKIGRCGRAGGGCQPESAAGRRAGGGCLPGSIAGSLPHWGQLGCRRI